jgi:hypothetical protein
MVTCFWRGNTFKPRHMRLTDKVYSRKDMCAFQEAEPIANDLSSLCYYAQSKPAKLIKISNYLEKKIRDDYRRHQLG